MPNDIQRWDYPAVIANGQSLSTAVHLNNATLVGLIIPPSWTAASITMQGNRFPAAAPDAWHNLRDPIGVELAVGGFVAGDWIVFPAGAVHGLEWIRFRSGTSGSPINQGGDRELIAILRPFR